MSTKLIQTFLPGSMHSFSRSIIWLSRMPRSTTLASSMEFSSGGPDSKLGEAMGMSSALVDSTPLLGVSENGSPTLIFTPTMTSVLPIFTREDPSAVSTTLVWMDISLNSSQALPSTRRPSAISL
ncbi:MAG: hypothetical protein A4E29_01512 [Methanomassiliicoccales archaeon PtaB.Bin134]|nr:MAG: hypothetical protein A4E29_01512 [Methanomassiliicoccales archaeon PtaB.Bin134]